MTVWVHVYLHPSDVNYFRARLERDNIERLISLGYRIELEDG